MAKKIIIISSGPVFIALALMAIVFVGIGRSQPTSIKSATSNIFSLIEANKWNEADIEVEGLLTKYPMNTELTLSVCDIADSYCWHRKYDGAGKIYSAIISKSSDATWTTKARLNMTRLEILKQIEEKKFWEAEARLNDMVRDFRDEPNLPVVIFHIGQEFIWQRGYDESKTAFDYLVNDFANIPLGQEAKLWQTRAQICSLIKNKSAKDDEISASIDKLITDFSSDSRLVDTLFWISREYEWTRGAISINKREQWYEAPNNLYQRLLSQFKYGQAEWDYKRLNHRMKIFNLIKTNDQNAIDTAIENMVTEFSGRNELPGELYWIACGYEEDPNKGEQAKQLYERIIKECPESTEAGNAVLDLRRLDIWERFKAEDVNNAKILTDKFISDFNQNIYCGGSLGRIFLKDYQKGLEIRKCRDFQKAKKSFQNVDFIWQKIISNKLQLGKEEGIFTYYAASNYQQLGQWDNAIKYYQIVADGYPDFEYAGDAQCAVGWCYESLLKEDAPKEQINPIIEDAYKKVISNYPECSTAHYAAFRLANIFEAKGDKNSAIAYYKKYLELAKPGFSNIDIIKAKIAELEQFDKLTVEEGTK